MNLQPSTRPHPAMRWVLGTAVVALSAAAMLAQAADAPPPSGHGPGHDMMGHRPHRAMARPPGAPGLSGLMNPRVLERIGASAEQRARVQDILRAAHADHMAQADSQRQLHQQMATLLAAPQIDAAAAEAVRQKLQAQHDAGSKRMLQATLDAAAVLTPEQRQQLSERMARRGEMMQRHQRPNQNPHDPRGRGAPEGPRS